MKREALLVAAIAAVWVCGCKHSDRAIDLKDGQIVTKGAVQVWRGQAFALTFDSKGIRMAMVTDESPARPGLVLCDIEGRMPVRVHSEGVLVPVLFSSDAYAVYCLRLHDVQARLAGAGETKDPPCELVRVDAAANVTDERSLSHSYLPYSRNFDGTLAVISPDNGTGPQYVVMPSGDLVAVESKAAPLLDMDGNYWFHVPGGWAKCSRDGLLTHEKARPGYLVNSQVSARGPMWLQKTDQTAELKGSSSSVSAIWLCHRRALTAAKGGQHPSQAALVDACAELSEAPDPFGFVPGREMIYIVTANDIRVVPFEFRPTPPLESLPAKAPASR